jgi:hypothetical protein
MRRLLTRVRAVIALSLAVQAVLGALWWWRPAALPPGNYTLALSLFPGVFFAWAAIHTSLLIGSIAIVAINLAYHVGVAALIFAAWRRWRPAV